MAAILRKIITAGTGEKIESKMPPLLEFFGPETLQVRRSAPVRLTKIKKIKSLFINNEYNMNSIAVVNTRARGK